MNFLAQKLNFSNKAKKKETKSGSGCGMPEGACRLKQEQDKYYGLCAGLYDDLRQNVVTKEEFERLHKEFQSKAQELEKAQEQQQDLIRRMLQKGVVSASRLAKFQDSLKLAEIDRHTLTSLVKRIYVYEDKRLEIEFYFRMNTKSCRNMSLHFQGMKTAGKGVREYGKNIKETVSGKRGGHTCEHFRGAKEQAV